MRDPNRLDDFYDKLKELHKKYFPDLRFGQLYSNFFTWLKMDKYKDYFYLEENQLIWYLEDYCEIYSGVNYRKDGD